MLISLNWLLAVGKFSYHSSSGGVSLYGVDATHMIEKRRRGKGTGAAMLCGIPVLVRVMQGERGK